MVGLTLRPSSFLISSCGRTVLNTALKSIVILTSSSPFPVSWKTPVFWEVSRCDLSALFPIWTLQAGSRPSACWSVEGQKEKTCRSHSEAQVEGKQREQLKLLPILCWCRQKRHVTVKMSSFYLCIDYPCFSIFENEIRRLKLESLIWGFLLSISDYWIRKDVTYLTLHQVALILHNLV